MTDHPFIPAHWYRPTRGRLTSTPGIRITFARIVPLAKMARWERRKYREARLYNRGDTRRMSVEYGMTLAMLDQAWLDWHRWGHLMRPIIIRPL